MFVGRDISFLLENQSITVGVGGSVGDLTRVERGYGRRLRLAFSVVSDNESATTTPPYRIFEEVTLEF